MFFWARLCIGNFLHFIWDINGSNLLRITGCLYRNFPLFSFIFQANTRMLTLNMLHPSDNLPIQYNHILRHQFSKPDYDMRLKRVFSNTAFNQLTAQTHSLKIKVIKTVPELQCSLCTTRGFLFVHRVTNHVKRFNTKTSCIALAAHVSLT